MRLTLITLLFSTTIMAMEWKYLPIEIYKVGATRFSSSQIQNMVKRTNQKLKDSKIKVIVKSEQNISIDELAFVNEDNLESLLQQLPSSQIVKLILIKEDQQYGNESWTYDPLPEDSDPLYEGLIFITEKWADNHDRLYEQRGYHPQNDTLLHELGHLLGSMIEHTRGPANFMHEETDYADDSINETQKQQMRKSPYLEDLLK